MKHAWAVLVVVGALVALDAAPSAAKIYRWVDPNGNVMFSDRPPQPGEAGGEKDRGPSRPDAPEQRDAPQAVDEALELSGLRRHLGVVADQIQLDVQQRPGQLSPQERAAVGRIMADAFRPDLVYSLMRDEFARHLDEGKLNDMLTWFRSPPGRKITGLEVAAQTAQGRPELRQYAARLRQTPPARERVALLQRLDAANGSTELSLEIVMLIAESMARAIDPLLPPERRLQAGQLQGELGQIRARAVQPIREAVLVTMLFTYRSLPDQELGAYVRLVESQSGRWFAGAVKNALLHSFGVSTARMAGDLVRLVPPERWSRGEFKKPPLPY